MYAVFDDMTEDDWEHALGGMHAVARIGDSVVGHAAVIQRRLMHRGVALRAGYVEAVAVDPAYQRQGIGAALMAPLERIIGAAYDLGALGATDEAVPFYVGRGWQAWRGPSSGLTPNGVVRTADDDGAIYVWHGRADLDLDGELICDWRGGDVW